MKNMKVSAKLIVSFVIVIVLAVIVGVVGIVGMYMINKADDGLYHNSYLPTVTADDISKLIVQQRVYARNFAIFDVNGDAEIFKKTENDLAASKISMDEHIKEYGESIETDEDRAIYNEFINVYTNDWLSFVNQIHDLGLNNKMEEAKVALTSATDVAGKMNNLTNALQQINLEEGENAVTSNTGLFTTMFIIVICVLIASVAVSIFLALYISGLISKPLGLLTSFMNKASSTGDITLRPEDIENIRKFSQNKDEIGQCIGSTASFINHIIIVGDALEVVSNGDLTLEFTLLSDKDKMGISLQKMMRNLSKMFAEINSSTMQVATAAKQIANGSQSLAQGSTEQASAVEQLSCSIAEIAQKTKDNAALALSASKLGNTIKSNAEKGSTQMEGMVQAVKDIGESSRSIGKIIKLIDDIAFQTNILALNAAVEAARAGQHGKGFAIVAEEVRSLASKSAEAAKNTDSLITDSIEKTELGVSIATETSESLAEIVSGINENSRIIEKIAESSEEQTAATDQVNKGIEQVAQVIAQNSGTAEESAAASEEMSGQASVLEDLVSQFRIK